jgi:hypothetical protein
MLLAAKAVRMCTYSSTWLLHVYVPDKCEQHRRTGDVSEFISSCRKSLTAFNIILQHPVVLYILTSCSHSSPSLCNFVDILILIACREPLLGYGTVNISSA